MTCLCFSFPLLLLLLLFLLPLLPLLYSCLVQLIKDSTDSESKIIFMDGTKDDPNKRKPDISLAKQELGWEPTVHVKDVRREKTTASA